VSCCPYERDSSRLHFRQRREQVQNGLSLDERDHASETTAWGTGRCCWPSPSDSRRRTWGVVGRRRVLGDTDGRRDRRRHVRDARIETPRCSRHRLSRATGSTCSRSARAPRPDAEQAAPTRRAERAPSGVQGSRPSSRCSSVATDQWVGVLFSLGVVGFAVTFALQQPLFSLIGWLYIMVKRPYQVGDRVAIRGVEGRRRRGGLPRHDAVGDKRRPRLLEPAVGPDNHAAKQRGALLAREELHARGFPLRLERSFPSRWPTRPTWSTRRT